MMVTLPGRLNLFEALVALDKLGKPEGKVPANDNKPSDPKAKGFNYGTGWTGAYPPVYYLASVVADSLREDMARASHKSWNMDMALRAMRHAENPEEFARATLRVEAEMAKLSPQTRIPA